MAYSDGPDKQSYAAIRSIYDRLTQYGKCLGDYHWPRYSIEYDRGTIGSATTSSISVSSAVATGGAWTGAPAGYGWWNPTPPNYGLPLLFKLYIDAADPKDCWSISAALSDADTYTADVQKWIDAGYIASASELENKTYAVTASYGVFWSERWPRQSRPALTTTSVAIVGLPYSVSIVGSGSAVTVTMASAIARVGDTVTIRGAVPDSLNGTAVVASIAGSAFTIASTAADTATTQGVIIFNGMEVATVEVAETNQFQSGDEVKIVGAVPAGFNGLYTITRLPPDISTHKFTYPCSVAGNATAQASLARKAGGDRMATWYRGRTDNWWTHTPEDEPDAGDPLWPLVRVPMPADQFTYWQADAGSGGGGSFVTEDCFDVDLWWTNRADTPDFYCAGPDLFKTVRGLQLGVEAMGFRFVPRVEGDYDGANWIPNYAPATLIGQATVDYQPFVPPEGWTGGGEFAEYNWQYVLDSAEGHGIPEFGSVVADIDGVVDWTAPAGSAWTLSPSWTRKYPRTFMYLYGKTCFIPDVEIDEFGSPIVHATPTADYPGVWTHRGKSTGYSLIDYRGFAHDNVVPFITGQVARYDGDAYADPSLHQDDQVSDITMGRPDGMNPQTPYFDRFNVSIPPADRGSKADRLSAGTATAGGTTWLASDQTWWTAAVTHSGTATSGDTTHLNDAAKAADPFWDSATGRFAGFVVEVEMSAGVWERAVIASSSAGALVLATALSASPSGKAYRIREPAVEINQWQDHELEISFPAIEGWPAVTLSTIVSRNDDAWLWFSACTQSDHGDTLSRSVTAGCTFTIRERLPGSVWKWSGTSHAKPSTAENDPRTGRPWPDDQWNICPTVITSAGRFRRGDYFGDWLFAELNAAVDKFGLTIETGTWVCDQWTGGYDGNSIDVAPDFYFLPLFSINALYGWAGSLAEFFDALNAGEVALQGTHNLDATYPDGLEFTADSFTAGTITVFPTGPLDPGPPFFSGPTVTTHGGTRHSTTAPAVESLFLAEAMIDDVSGGNVYSPDASCSIAVLSHLATYELSPRMLAGTAKVLNRGHAPTGKTFADYGWACDGHSAVRDGSWSVMGTLSVSTSAPTHSGLLGVAAAPPTYPGPPAAPASYPALVSVSLAQGFELVDVVSLVEWTV